MVKTTKQYASSLPRSLPPPALLAGREAFPASAAPVSTGEGF